MSDTGGVGTVTLLFTDLVGSTELLDTLGDERAGELTRSYFEILRAAAAEHQGDEVKSLGDGLMLAFRGTLQALACAASMQRAVADHNSARADSRSDCAWESTSATW